MKLPKWKCAKCDTKPAGYKDKTKGEGIISFEYRACIWCGWAVITSKYKEIVWREKELTLKELGYEV